MSVSRVRAEVCRILGDRRQLEVADQAEQLELFKLVTSVASFFFVFY